MNRERAGYEDGEGDIDISYINKYLKYKNKYNMLKNSNLI